MLKIRQEQIDALQAAMDRSLIDWIIGQLRLEHAELADVADTNLAENVASALSRARRHGFAESMHLFRFVDSLFRYGDDVDAKIDRSLLPEARLDAMISAVARP